MSGEKSYPTPSKAQKNGMWIGIIVAVVAFQMLGPEKTEPGFDFTRVLWAAGAGAVGAVLGSVIGRLFDR